MNAPTPILNPARKLWLLALLVAMTLGMARVINAILEFPAVFSTSCALLLLILFMMFFLTINRIHKNGFRWLFTHEARQIRIRGFLAFCSIIILFYNVENWRGCRNLAHLKTELAARGEKWGITSLILPPIPEEQNFAKTPLLDCWRDNRSRITTQIGSQTNSACERAAKIRLPSTGSSMPQSGWTLAQGTDFVAWQKAFAGDTNYPTSAVPISSAATVRLALSKFDPEIKELRDAAAQRPLGRFPTFYSENLDEMFSNWGFSSTWPHIKQVLELRASAGLANGDTQEAYQDLKLMFRIFDAVNADPSHLQNFTSNLSVNSLQPVWEGLANHQWTEPQLEEFQKRFESMNLLEDCHTALLGETSTTIATCQLLAQVDSLSVLRTNSWKDQPELCLAVLVYPRGWLYQDQVITHQIYQQFLAAVDTKAKRVFQPHLITPPTDPGYRTWIMARFKLMELSAISTFAYVQTITDEAAIACALERYFQANGQYPEALKELSPRFIRQVPWDVITGQPLKYQRTPDGQFVLYSVGWDGVDNGGKIDRTWKDGVGNIAALREGNPDWVWRCPAKKGTK